MVNISYSGQYFIQWSIFHTVVNSSYSGQYFKTLFMFSISCLPGFHVWRKKKERNNLLFSALRHRALVYCYYRYFQLGQLVHVRISFLVPKITLSMLKLCFKPLPPHQKKNSRIKKRKKNTWSSLLHRKWLLTLPDTLPSPFCAVKYTHVHVYVYVPAGSCCWGQLVRPYCCPSQDNPPHE